MKLAALGLVVAVVGIAIGVDGLILSGAFWIAIGQVGRLTRNHYEAQAANAATAPEGIAATDGAAERGADGRPERAIPLRVATILLLAIGLPSLAIGVFAIGFESPDLVWRWVPIAVGALALASVLIPGLMLATSSGMLAVADSIGVAEHPARVTIEGSRETGTYINERPRLEFELLVEPEGREAYGVTKRATVPHTALGSIRIGDGFEALVALDKPDAIEIDWDEPIPDPPSAENGTKTPPSASRSSSSCAGTTSSPKTSTPPSAGA